MRTCIKCTKHGLLIAKHGYDDHLRVRLGAGFFDEIQPRAIDQLEIDERYLGFLRKQIEAFCNTIGATEYREPIQTRDGLAEMLL